MYYFIMHHTKTLTDLRSYNDAASALQNAIQNAILFKPDLVNVHINLHYFG